MKRHRAHHTDGDTPGHFSEHDLAERWNISPRTLQRWRAERIGPAWIVIGGSIRYAFADITAYEAAARRGGSK